jgi:general secretion pathway protein F
MRFRSTVLEADGSTRTAVLDAADEQELHARLHDEGRTLLEVRELEEASDEAEEHEVEDVALSSRRLLLLTQALFEALDAGVPLLGTFAAIAEQEEDPRIAALLTSIGERVAAGQSLSDTLEMHRARSRRSTARWSAPASNRAACRRCSRRSPASSSGASTSPRPSSRR